MGSFYSVCTGHEITGLVQLTKGYDYEVLSRLSIKNFEKLVNRLKEDRAEEIVYRLYLALLPRMTQETYVSFNDFYSMTKKDSRPMSEIRAELDQAEAAFKRKEEADGTIQTVGQHPDQE